MRRVDLGGLIVRERALILAASLLVAGCAAPVTGVAMTDDGQVASPWAEAEIKESSDKNLRKVPRASGEYFTYLPAETAAQTICHTMPSQRWSELLHGPVRREIYGGSPACLVTSNRMRVELTPQDIDPDGWRPYRDTPPPRDIRYGDRPGRISVTAEAPFQADGYVALVDDSSGRNLNALTFRITAGSLATMDRPPAFTKLVDDVLAEVVETLAEPSPPLPTAKDQTGEIDYIATPPAPRGGIVDAPLPLAALQLCTAAEAVLAHDPATLRIRPTDGGWCALGVSMPIVVTRVDHTDNRAELTETIAGRPGKRKNDKEVSVLLRDDAPVTLEVRFQDGDPVEFAAKIVPLLLAG